MGSAQFTVMDDKVVFILFIQLFRRIPFDTATMPTLGLFLAFSSCCQSKRVFSVQTTFGAFLMGFCGLISLFTTLFLSIQGSPCRSATLLHLDFPSILVLQGRRSNLAKCFQNTTLGVFNLSGTLFREASSLNPNTSQMSIYLEPGS